LRAIFVAAGEPAIELELVDGTIAERIHESRPSDLLAG
jgi:hypothetical protein